MKVIVCPVGSIGDVHPFIGISEALQQRGHDVRVLINEYFEPLLQQTSLHYEITGDKETFQKALAHPDMWHPSKGVPLVAKHIYTPAMRFTYPYLEQHADPGDTLTLGPGWAFGARLANEKLGIPYLTTNVAPSQFRSSIKPPKFGGLWLPDWVPRWVGDQVWKVVDGAVIDRALCPHLNAYRKELGLRRVNRVFHYWMNSPNGVLGLFPEWFGEPQADWPQPTYLSGFPLFDEASIQPPDTDLQAFLDHHPNPLVFTPGSANQHARAFFEIAIKLCRKLDKPGLLLTKFGDQIPNRLPANVKHYHYVPLSRVLPQASAFIYHGGIGSCAQALRAGVPQLVTAMAFDQHDNGARIQGLGVGQWLDAKHYRYRKAKQLVSDLLNNPRIHNRCQQIRQRLEQQDALKDICDTIETVGDKAFAAHSNDAQSG